jgi:hypothetical protein
MRTFVVEAVDLVDVRGLVVAAEQEEILGILDLVCQQKTYGFERLLAGVDVVAEEGVIRLRWEAAVFEQPQEIAILPVDVAFVGVISVVKRAAIDAGPRRKRCVRTHRKF